MYRNWDEFYKKSALYLECSSLEIPLYKELYHCIYIYSYIIHSSIKIEITSYCLALSTESSDFAVESDSLLLTIPPSPSLTASLLVSILDDKVVERREESFSVSLSSSQSRVTISDSDTAIITISDDDSECVTSYRSSSEGLPHAHFIAVNYKAVPLMLSCSHISPWLITCFL